MHNFFVVLGLDPNVTYSKEDLKKRYNILAKENHPDMGGDPVKFKEICHAYHMLSDPSYRALQTKNNINLNINFQVPIDFEDAFFGKEITISYNRFEVFEDSKLVIKKEQDPHVLIFTYPAGQMGGYNHHIPGGGVNLKGKYGDCIINFLVKQHPRYQVDSDGNIITQEKIELETMIKGGKIEVQTLYGLKTARVPPGTKPGDKIKIYKCGVLKMANHLIDPQPIYPTKEELKSKRKFNNLDINWQEFQEEQQEKDNSIYINGQLIGNFTLKG